MASFIKLKPRLNRPAAVFLGSVGLACASSAAGAAAAPSLLSAEICEPLGGFIIPAAIGGAAIAFLIAAFLYRHRYRAMLKQLRRSQAKITTLSEAHDAYRALTAIEPQCCIRWSGENPELIHHTLPSAIGIPSKLPQILRLGSWLHEEDAEAISACFDKLIHTGQAFSAQASTLDGHVLEVIGGVAGPNPVVTFRLFTPVNKELVRVIGENKKLKHDLEAREMLLDGLPMPIWFRGAKGELVWVNRAYVQAVSAKERDAVITTQAELFETRQRAELMRALRAKKPGRVRLQTVTSGRLQVYDAVVTPVGKGSAGAALDVASLASARDELSRQIAAHSRTLNRVSTGVVIFGPDQKLTYHNEAFSRIWRFDRTKLEGRSASEIFDALRRQRLLPEHANYRKWRDRLLAFEDRRSLDDMWHLPDGRTIHVLSDHRDDGGLTLLFDDVTERLALERQYHSLIEVRQETLDHLGEGIAVFGSNGRLQLVNPAFLLLWGLPEDAIPNDAHLEDVIRVCDGAGRSRSSLTALWAEARRAITDIDDAREAFHGTIELRGDVHLSYTGTPLPDGGTLLTFTDITDSKRVEVVLRERNEALEASDRLKSAFLSHVSYELRTPLTSIIGFSDMLGQPGADPLTPKQQEYLSDIRSSGQVLLTLINDILDLAVIDAGALDLKLTPTRIVDVIEGARLGVKDRLAKMQIDLSVHIANGVDTVLADENRLIQILYNLLSNAIAFSAEGSTITLACRKEKGGTVFSVQDTGPGIPEEEQDVIFDRFNGAGGRRSRHRGAGLGLSLVKSLVELHNGNVTLRSTPGAGTTVSVFLPDKHSSLKKSSPSSGLHETATPTS